MKVPGNPAQPTGPRPSPESTASRSVTLQGEARQSVESARAQLDALKLSVRETALARVAEIRGQQQGKAEQMVLDIRGSLLKVQAAIGETSLQTGDWVKVMRAGNELQLMGKLAPSAESSVSRALARHLPWQQSIDSGLSRLFAALQHGLRPPATPGQTPGQVPQPLPAPVRQAVEQLFARLPGSSQFTPGAGNQPRTVQQVRQWIADSGLFSEAQRLQSPQQPPTDLKAALSRIVTALLAQQGQEAGEFTRLRPLTSPELVQSPLQFPTPMAAPGPAASGESPTAGQMLRLLAGMLNRISVNQLHSQALTARTGGDGAPAPTSTLLLELPFLPDNQEPRTVQVRIDQYRDEAGQREGKPPAGVTEWRLSLAMNLDQTGPLHFDVALRNRQVSAVVWAEQQRTLQQVHQELPLLHQSLDELGLTVENLECRRGTPQGATTKLEHRLVDTRA
jgi:hypothetical protein